MGQVASFIHNRRTRQRNQNQHEVRNNADPEIQMAYSSSNGAYFGTHFLMCGCKFELAKPESYLFGDNSDLDQLGAKSMPFPHPIGPPGSDEIRPLNLKINVRKETVRFSRPKNYKSGVDDNKYILHFTFDSDVDCLVTIHLFARESYLNGNPVMIHRNNRQYVSDVYEFGPGANQQFSEYLFDSSPYILSELSYKSGLYYPLVISMRTVGNEHAQMQTTLCTLEHTNDSTSSFAVKPLRQKIASDGIVYLLQEIFGIENKEHDGDDSGLECIICMSEVRDTVILPCRHLCLCSNCADTLRYKLNNCPICRAPFRALIRLRAGRQNRHQVSETISLVEGLNGSHAMSRLSESEETRSNNEVLSKNTVCNNTNGVSVHEVLTLEELENDKALTEECIEMEYIKSEEIIRRESVENTEDDGFIKDSTSSATPILKSENGVERVQTSEEATEINDDEGVEDEEHEALQKLDDRRKSLQRGSRSSSSQLLDPSK